LHRLDAPRFCLRSKIIQGLLGLFQLELGLAYGRFQVFLPFQPGKGLTCGNSLTHCDIQGFDSASQPER
jgi:hypothetical protein